MPGAVKVSPNDQEGPTGDVSCILRLASNVEVDLQPTSSLESVQRP